MHLSPPCIYVCPLCMDMCSCMMCSRAHARNPAPQHRCTHARTPPRVHAPGIPQDRAPPLVARGGRPEWPAGRREGKRRGQGRDQVRRLTAGESVDKHTFSRANEPGPRSRHSFCTGRARRVPEPCQSPPRRRRPIPPAPPCQLNLSLSLSLSASLSQPPPPS